MAVHESALYVRSKRNAVLASNLANADTPDYKARDIDFKSLLQNAVGQSTSTSLKTTNAKHMQLGGNSIDKPELLYRHPYQPAIDGNTVDAQMEKVKFAENATQYQATLGFLTGRIKGLKSAITGE